MKRCTEILRKQPKTAKHGRRRIFFVIGMLILSSFWPRLTFAQQESERATDRSPLRRRAMVVLTNGNVLEGIVSKEAEDFVLELDQGSRLVLQTDDVWFVCDSMESAYWGKLSRIKATDLGSLVKLFHWCIQTKQFDFARNQIDILQGTRIRAARLNFLNEQLALAIERSVSPMVPTPAAALEPTAQQSPQLANSTLIPTGSGGVKKIEMRFQPLPSLDSDNSNNNRAVASPVLKTIRSPVDSKPSEVIQVGYTEPIPASVSASPVLKHAEVSPIHVPVSVRELESLCRELPKGTLGKFRLQVEKVFVMRCSECHEMDSQVMPLLHGGRLQTATRRMSQRNLHSVLRFVDKADPLNSRLLEAATTAHGGARSAGMNPGEPAYENLTKWIISISDRPELATTPKEPQRIDVKELEAAEIKPINPNALKPSDQKAVAELLGISTAPTEKAMNSEDEFKPKDDFDPEIFNRQMHKR